MILGFLKFYRENILKINSKMIFIGVNFKVLLSLSFNLPWVTNHFVAFHLSASSNSAVQGNGLRSKTVLHITQFKVTRRNLQRYSYHFNTLGKA